MNFKTIKKAGLSALLVATLFQSGTVEAASSMKRDHQPNAEQVTNNAPKVSLSEQEKNLLGKQLEYWKKVKKHREFSDVLPHIRNNLDLSKIETTHNDILIPFGNERYLGCYKGEYSPSLFVHTYRHDNGSYIFPTHEVPEFIQDKADCYFYTPKKDLKGLSSDEVEYIQTFDKCLNAIYHHMYGIGFTDIDEEKLASGEYAGYSYETKLLLFKTAPTEIKRKLSPLENKFMNISDFPCELKTLLKKQEVGL